MSEFYNLIKRCEDLKTNAKIEEIKKVSNNNCIKDIFCFMLDEVKYTYNTKKIVNTEIDYKIITINSDNALIMSINELLKFNLNKSKELDKYIDSIYKSCNNELKEVFKWIIDRKNPAKIGAHIVNSVWNDLVFEKLYMGASSQNIDEIDFSSGYMIQDKEDGMCVLAKVNDKNEIELRTRQGNDIAKYFPIAMNKLKSSINDIKLVIPYASFEAMIIKEDGSFMRREDANGLFNSMTNGEYNKDIDDNVRFVCWELCDLNEYNIFGKDFTKVEDRYENIKLLAKKSNGFITPVYSEIVYSLNDVRKITDNAIKNGKEGKVLKKIGTPWVNSKPSYIIKLKNEMCVDCIITGYNKHSKDENLIGSLIIESSCGKMVCNVGSGLNPKLRSLPFSYYDGKILPIKCEELTKNKNKKTIGMKHPRILTDYNDDIVFRIDKGSPDSLEDMIAEMNSTKGI